MNTKFAAVQAEITLGVGLANERKRYYMTVSLLGMGPMHGFTEQHNAN